MRIRLTGFARSLRQRETPAEQLLWRELRNRQIDSWKFKGQVPHGKYVLDFFCADAGLAIEVDGMQHLEDRACHDDERTAYLERNGVRVLRFWNAEVSENLPGVLEAIYRALGQKSAPSPGAARRARPGGRGDAAASTEDRAKK